MYIEKEVIRENKAKKAESKKFKLNSVGNSSHWQVLNRWIWNIKLELEKKLELETGKLGDISII